MPSVVLISFSCFCGDEDSLAVWCGTTICPAGQVNGSASQVSAEAQLLPVSWRQGMAPSLIEEAALTEAQVVDGQSELGDQRRIRSANRNCR